MSCFSAGPPNLEPACTDLALLISLSASLVAMMAAFAASISACLIACVMICSAAFFLWFLETALCESALC